MIRTVIDLFENTAERFPGKTAFEDEHTALTFGSLRTGAEQIAGRLCGILPPRTPVLIYMPKSPEMIQAFLGVLYAGCWYIPVDTDMPENRIRHMAERSGAKTVICTAAEPFPYASGMDHVLLYEDLLSGAAGSAGDDADVLLRRQAVTDSDPAYAIFTSGSTGMPKGVLIRHASLLKLAQWFTETFGIDENEVIANQNAFFFDGSVKEIYGTLISGAHMYIVPKKLFALPAKLIGYLNDHDVTLINWMPSILCMIVKFRTFAKIRPLTVRKVLFAGEVMPVPQFLQWHEALPDALFANLYGPTEATVDSTYYIVDDAFIRKAEADTADLSIPIGRACCNTDIFLLDDADRKITEPGISGEICIRGTCLSPGYLHDPDRTAEVFVRNPLNSLYYETIYRTGDYARYNEDGDLLFIGRRDSQIKHMDHRIELGEIEEAICRLPAVEKACCVYDRDAGMILAFYEAPHGSVPAGSAGSASGTDSTQAEEEAAVLASLKEYLPRYMMPRKITKLEALPLTPNGKTDRIALLQQAAGNRKGK